MRVVGIDISAAGIRVVRLDKGFRDIAIHGVTERAFAQPSGPDTGEIEKTLLALKQEGALEGEVWATSLQTEKGFLRIMEAPAADAEKTNILVRNDLDGATPLPIDELTTVASQILKSDKGKLAQVLAAVVPSPEVSSLLSRFSTAAIDPQLVTLDGAALGSLAGRLSQSVDTVFLDLGMQTSTLIITQNGTPVVIRSLKQGLWPMVKRLSRASEVPPAEFLRKIEQVTIPEALLQEVAQPLVVEIRRSIQSARKNGAMPAHFILSGEGSRVRSLSEGLSALAGLTSVPFSLGSLKFKSQVEKKGNVVGMSPLFTIGAERYARAFALALAGLDKAKALSLRQGNLAFRGDFSRVAGQVARIASFMAVLLSLAGGAAYAKYRVLKAEEKQAVAKLSKSLKEATGKDLSELDAIDTFLTGSDKSNVKKPWPAYTGFDVLLAISQRIPDTVKLDINKINIQPKKTTIQGEIDNAGDVDAITTALKDFKDCFKEMKPGSVKQITTRDGRLRHDFTLDIETTCP